MAIRFGTISPLYTYMPRKRIFKELLRKFGRADCQYCLFQGDPETDNMILFTPEATHELMNLFYWGKRHPLNIFEQQAGLVGHFFAESAQRNRCYTLVISHVLPAHCSERNPIGAKLLKEHKADMLDEIRILNQNRRRGDFDVPAFEGDYTLLGIVHSHPNSLDVFMSGTDFNTHMLDNNTDLSYKLSMIINPHRKLMIAYGGKRIIETHIQLMVWPEDLAEFRGDAMTIGDRIFWIQGQLGTQEIPEQKMDFAFMRDSGQQTTETRTVPAPETEQDEFEKSDSHQERIWDNDPEKKDQNKQDEQDEQKGRTAKFTCETPPNQTGASGAQSPWRYDASDLHRPDHYGSAPFLWMEDAAKYVSSIFSELFDL